MPTASCRSTRSWSAPPASWTGRPPPRSGTGRGRTRGAAPPRRVGFRPPSRITVLDRLDRDGLLPAITFVFSRAGCDAAVAQCVRAGLRLTTEDEVGEIRRVVERRTGDLPQADLGVLGYWEWREALERGIAAHHAGLLPAFKETVEELFVRGLVRAVFATETLALGINMPARTVVLERLVKFNGEAHAELTPGEYTQLTGRAGRRGIDVEGHAVVVWQPGVDPRAGRRAGLDPHLPAAQLLPARLQHGRQPRRPARRRGGPRAAGAVVRPVPGRPVGGRAGPADRAQHRDPRRVRGLDALSPRRLRRVRRAAPPGRRAGEGAAPPGAWPSSATRRRTRCARCGPATSSRCRAGGAPGWPSSWTPA